MKQTARALAIDLMTSGHAHATLAAALKGLSIGTAGRKPKGAAHTAWELIEHIRIAQNDIVQFVTKPKYVSPPWPKGYWPAKAKPANEAEWRRSLAGVKRDLAAMVRLLRTRDLLAPLAHAPEKCVLQEALLLADHNAYHIGQLVELRKTLGDWK